MSTTSTNPLRELHQCHQRIATLREQLDRGPRQIAAKQNHLNQRSELLEKARSELKVIKVHNHDKEAERKSYDARIHQLQTQINTAKTNKEYVTLVSERDGVTKTRAGVEDKILEGMMREEAKLEEIKSSEADVEKLRKELSDLEAVIGQRTGDLAERMKQAESDLARAEVSLPPDSRQAYRRLVDRRGGADSLAPVANATCTGCYTQITPQMLNHVMMNELVICKSCGRIVYLEEPIP